MVHHRFDTEAADRDAGARRKAEDDGSEEEQDKTEKSLQIPSTEVFEIITQHR